jgi:hypothetical protein
MVGKKIAGVLCALVALATLHTGAATAAPPETHPAERRATTDPLKSDDCFFEGCTTDSTAEGDSGSDQVSTTASGTGWSVSCSGTNDQAHYSYGAGGAIYKTRITCTGYGVSSVFVNYEGRLSFAPSIGCSTSNLAWQLRASSSYGQWVTVNGATKTYYTPRPGSHGGEGLGWWKGNTTWWFTHDGVRSTTGSDHDYWCLDLRPS